MKKGLILSIFFFSICSITWGQRISSGINYQAVVRDAKGDLLTNQPISIRIQLRTGYAEGKILYVETHDVITNGAGLFSIAIGTGQAERGDFTQIPWSEFQIWMDLALDERRDHSFIPLISSPIMNFPYGFYSWPTEKLVEQLNEQNTEKRRCDHTGIPFWTNLGNYNVNEACHFLGTTVPVGLIMKTNNVERMRIQSNGKVGIGTIMTPDSVGNYDIRNYRLFVAGGILTDELRVRTGWADHVLEASYPLSSLDEVEQHIQREGHLPGVPSSAQVEVNGLGLGENAVIQQTKIEELFLYLILMNKEIKALKLENEKLKTQMEAIQNR